MIQTLKNQFLAISGLVMITSLSQSAFAAHSIEFGKDSAFPVEITLNKAEVIARYNLSTDLAGEITKSQDGHRAVFDVTVSFFKDKVRFDFYGSTGATFKSSGNTFGSGTPGEEVLDYKLRRMSMTLSPGKGLDVSFGGLAPSYGAGTENSYLDGDGYIMGYRAKAKIENSTLVVTGGYLGDLKEPSVFDRMDRMGDLNYLQVLLTQAIGQLIVTSLDYNHVDGDSYLRGAVKIQLSQWVKFLDSLVVEDMVKMTGDEANLLAATLKSKFKDIFGERLPGRDLEIALTYAYMTDEVKLPVGDKIFDGHSVRVKISLPNLVKFGKVASMGIYADYVQDVADLDRLAFESGLLLSF
jgi:hypothetical protein